jgi:uncharacterized protein (TIGR03435 family)
MRCALVAVLLLVIANETIPAQPSESFEVASVKPSRPGTLFNSKLDPALFTCSANSLLVLILGTYPDVSASRIAGGPAWLNTDYWDVVAKLPPNMPTIEKELNRKAELMLQTLLADRFRLQTHREKRNQQVYALVVAKTGVKLKQAAPWSGTVYRQIR